jgi:hypothetical protein
VFAIADANSQNAVQSDAPAGWGDLFGYYDLEPMRSESAHLGAGGRRFKSYRPDHSMSSVDRLQRLIPER